MAETAADFRTWGRSGPYKTPPAPIYELKSPAGSRVASNFRNRIRVGDRATASLVFRTQNVRASGPRTNPHRRREIRSYRGTILLCAPSWHPRQDGTRTPALTKSISHWSRRQLRLSRSRVWSTARSACHRVAAGLMFRRRGQNGAPLLDSHWEPIRIEAGWPGSLKRLPVSATFVPSTLRIEMSWSR